MHQVKQLVLDICHIGHWKCVDEHQVVDLVMSEKQKLYTDKVEASLPKMA